ncbi:YbaB/EbfC family nucleoid-associated protein [Pedomonas mirosovicensis]|uniref:YbaB/EbfC family nucleoid-associated protein n=1 Tax=Pedomonas mirosovicensis TaxID=2908641 RepID=UPI002167D751|nr:YbaB/EbfC family nucleoid-associated protein [Pedomonas mirosovicensis]MCH8685773.1 YbaB/EbfC family nucleoid-associated protein [Pedomonas mirosovicensis]
MNIQEIMKAAQNMQAKMAEAQAKLDTIEVEGQSGAGLVKVTATAKGKIVRVSIDPSLVDPNEKDVLEDLVAAAINDLRAKADAKAQEEMGKLTQGMPLPPGMKMPF